MNKDKTLRTKILNIAKNSPDGFAWNPYSWNRINELAGRMLKTKYLKKSNFQTGRKDQIFLRINNE